MNISQTELEQTIANHWFSGKMKGLARDWCQSESVVDALFQMNRHKDGKLAWRSAYMLDLIHDINPPVIEPYLSELLDQVVNEPNQSIKRHYLRILAQHDLSDKVNGIFVDACFTWLNQQETPIAVKAHCMAILHQLCQVYPELVYELKVSLEALLPYGSKGEINRAKKILKELEKHVV